MKTQILLLSISLIMITGCLKPDDDFIPTLPPITTTGENTFGCYVDGQLLTPRDGTGYMGVPDWGMRFVAGPTPPDYDYHEIVVRDFVTGTGGILKIHFDNLQLKEEGEYTINESNCQDGISANENINITCRWWDEKEQVFKWYCSIEESGALTILRNSYEEGILSGTFYCTAQNQNDPNDLFEITEGRFDINGYTLPSTEFP